MYSRKEGLILGGFWFVGFGDKWEWRIDSIGGYKVILNIFFWGLEIFEGFVLWRFCVGCVVCFFFF